MQMCVMIVLLIHISIYNCQAIQKLYRSQSYAGDLGFFRSTTGHGF